MPADSAADRDLKHIERAIAARHTCISIVTPEEDHARHLITTAVAGTTGGLWWWSASRGIHSGPLENNPADPSMTDATAALNHFAHTLDGPGACVMLDLTDHLSDARTLRALRDVIRRFRRRELSLILLDHAANLPPVIAAEAVTIDISPPDEAELERIIRSTLQSENIRQKIDVTIRRSELRTIVRNLRGLTRTQAEQIIRETIVEDRRFHADDINTILAHKRQRLGRGGILEYVEAPVDLTSIGGLGNLKKWLSHRQNALSEEAVEFGLSPPRGVLLLGVQGAGKSLAAKAIATAWQRPLLLLDAGRLYDKYIGESERRLRDALRQAEMMAPIILWIDEIEKGFASAASQSTDGGLSQRMFGTLLTWMAEHTAPVFLVATANNIDALPPELLRKGRFDEIFWVDLPSAAARREIFAIHIKKRGRDPKSFDLDALATASEGYSGAEIEQAVIAALHESFANKKPVNTAKVKRALAASPPLSVTMAERIAAQRRWAKGRCVGAE